MPSPITKGIDNFPSNKRIENVAPFGWALPFPRVEIGD
jgi:hypothetical protein